MTTNVNDVETSIKHQLHSLRQYPSNPCIRKVPEFMAKENIRSGCFERLIVSICPFYYGKEALKTFHEMKLRHLQFLLQHADKDFDLGQYVYIISEQEQEIRSYYSEKSIHSSSGFIEMIMTKLRMTTNVNDVQTSIKHQLHSLRQYPSNPCIRKVPEFMAKENIRSGCFEPLVVSIGPFYYDKEALKTFHEMKLRHLLFLLQHADKDFDLGHYIDIIKEQEHEIRSYYSEKSILSSNGFIEMIVIDAAFIIVFLMRSNLRFMATHPMKNQMEVCSEVTRDLFLVENQLPFFVLYDLFNKAFGVGFPDVTFKDVVCFYIISKTALGREVADKLAVREKLRDISNIQHLVQCLRICCLPTKLRCDQFPLGTGFSGKLPKTVKELKEAGVKFIASEPKSLLDIIFSKGVLQIPKLTIEGTTRSILRSMAFYEQCHQHFDSYIIDYLFLMDALIDTPEDVKILVQNGIIKSLLGSDEQVANLFNHVTKNLQVNKHQFYYAHLVQELDAYANTKWNHRKAVLRRDYFKYPWSIMSLIYLVVLLILTALQVYTGFKA